MKRFVFALCIVTCAFGCNKEAAPEGGDATGSGTDPKTGQSQGTVNNPAVMSEPPSTAAPGQSIRIQPSDPNDPKFQADPKLAGGG